MAVIGVTAKLEYEQGSGWAEVLKCKMVSFPSMALTTIETTNLSSPNYAKEFQGGMLDAGNVTFEAEFTEETYSALQTILADRTVIGWRITGPDDEAVVVTCDGVLLKADASFSPDEEVMISGEIKMTGLPTVS